MAAGYGVVEMGGIMLWNWWPVDDLAIVMITADRLNSVGRGNVGVEGVGV